IGIGIGVGVLAVLLELALRKVPTGVVAGGVLGLIGGLVVARLATIPFGLAPATGVVVLLNAVFGYVGIVFGITRLGTLDFSSLRGVLSGGARVSEDEKIIDTSAIIDGRIADVCDTGFVSGKLIVPQFVLRELQFVADSSDPLKRAKGRRGLDILHRMQKTTEVRVEIVDEDFPKLRNVDDKLVAMARQRGAKIVTNDFNLNKVAVLQGVAVLNINELSNAVKPLVLPGEIMRIVVLKEGKEYGQGVAYLDDGTMIVVEDGRRLIGKTIDVTVTSVLQTTAGRMIFTKPREEVEREEAQLAGGRV
ncbi:MAG: TRAM domain-containing protein, partial [Nitrospirota bacterium]|nr:TRAM domain-containing protein [Nitrospirota bacterium]